jgi:hypothetical protein
LNRLRIALEAKGVVAADLEDVMADLLDDLFGESDE